MKSAFGMKLEQGSDKRYFTGNDETTGNWVSFAYWPDKQHWTASLSVGGFMVTESIGSASMEACYRSLRGRVKNLRNSLDRLVGGR